LLTVEEEKSKIF
jgi:hypothetical protein